MSVASSSIRECSRIEHHGRPRYWRLPGRSTRGQAVTEHQRNLLARRLRASIARQPEIGALRSLLLGIGGVEFVAPSFIDHEISALISSGFTMDSLVECESMEPNACHSNTARLWIANESGLVGIGTGYALSDDGLWRQHSWGIRRNGILETTKRRVKYFGIALQGRDAESFAKLNR
jgi:hypothetical protein